MNSIEKLLNIARAERGYLEKETNANLDNPTANAGDENYTKYARDLAKAHYYQASKQGYDWCDMFVDWCFLQLCGSKALAEKVQCQTGPYGAGCYYSAQYYNNQGRLFYTDPQPGDQIFFNDYAHTGLVEKVENGRVYTIEGNSSNRVAYLWYNVNDSRITSFGRPRWDLVPEEVSFVDVADDAWYAEAVKWAVEAGVANGVDETHFAPDAVCNRAQAMTMLWRAYGSQKLEGTYNPFMDISEKDYYYNAVLWALQKGITSGVDNLHFGPDEACTRGQMVTFMWRADSKPTGAPNANFSDVNASDYCYDAVNWAVQKGIANGVGNNEFAPEDKCTRAQTVTMLWRMTKQ